MIDFNGVLNLCKIYDNYCNARILYIRPQYKPDHIFDEDKSVKWNREEVIRQNLQLKQESENYHNTKRKLFMDAKSAILEYIQGETGLSEKDVEVAYEDLDQLAIECGDDCNHTLEARFTIVYSRCIGLMRLAVSQSKKVAK